MRCSDDQIVTDYPYGEMPRDEAYESGFAIEDAKAELARELGRADLSALSFEPLFLRFRVVGLIVASPEAPRARAPYVVARERCRGLGQLALELVDELDADLVARPLSPLVDYAVRRGFTSLASDRGLVRLAPPRRAPRAIHGASMALVHVPTRVVLLGRRLREPLLDHLAFPGGKVEAGESALEAARRELLEEVGLVAPAAPKLETRVYGGAGEGAVFALDCFAVPVDEPRPPVTTSEMEASWTPLHVAQSMRPMAPGTQRVLRRLRESFDALR